MTTYVTVKLVHDYFLAALFIISPKWEQSKCPSMNERINKICYMHILGFPGGSDSKESACNVGDLGLISELGRFPGGGHGNPFQYSCLENPHGERSLAGYSWWGCQESDMSERLRTTHMHILFGHMKEWHIDKCCNLDEPQKYYATWKKTVIEIHIVYYSIHMKVQNR